jgi:hypothetical protein
VWADGQQLVNTSEKPVLGIRIQQDLDPDLTLIILVDE